MKAQMELQMQEVNFLESRNEWKLKCKFYLRVICVIWFFFAISMRCIFRHGTHP
ncbi:hypothetical protein M6B38_371020 [Iris pallida]|uniref:Uncharacterized protein n=1 Tax=Iris pallida TaxID=29817 RepID=A0AAX6GCP3_IRIPA|nr:hypothetical protein M6B38_371850 [Iris pallida]KAJ6826676.1 hypothetical protein M6B38_371020 [Iris pallida]